MLVFFYVTGNYRMYEEAGNAGKMLFSFAFCHTNTLSSPLEKSFDSIKILSIHMLDPAMISTFDQTMRGIEEK